MPMTGVTTREELDDAIKVCVCVCACACACACVCTGMCGGMVLDAQGGCTERI